MKRSLSQLLLAFTCFLLAGGQNEAVAQSPDNESRFFLEYEQYAQRTELSATKLNTVVGGALKGNDDAALAITREIANLREELAEMLNQATRHNISRQKAGMLESRRLLYLTEAGNSMMNELGVMFILPRRNELPLLRSLERYREIRKILEWEMR